MSNLYGRKEKLENFLMSKEQEKKIFYSSLNIKPSNFVHFFSGIIPNLVCDFFFKKSFFYAFIPVLSRETVEQNSEMLILP